MQNLLQFVPDVTDFANRQRPSGFDYGGGGGGGLKPQYNRGKPGGSEKKMFPTIKDPSISGGAKTTVKNPNSFSVVGNSMKQGGEVGEQAAVYRIQVCVKNLLIS